MNTVQRLETLAVLAVLGAEDGIPDDRYQSVKVHLEAVLSDGRGVVLFDDRGWSSSGPADAWRYESVDSVTATARTVVGPD